MEYQVPQFIEVEDKIFGPLTLRQFIYIAGGAGLCAVFILLLPLFIGLILAIPVAAFAAALAFYKINGKPFIDVLEAGFTYYVGRRLYLWRKEQEVPGASQAAQAPVAPTALPKEGLTRRKLEDLELSLDTKQGGPSI